MSILAIGDAVAVQGKTADSVQQGFLDNVMRFFPVETAIAYTYWLSTLTPLSPPSGDTTKVSYQSRWELLAAFALLTVCLTFASIHQKVRRTKAKDKSLVKKLFPYAAALGGFLAWAFAQSDTVLKGWWQDFPNWAPVVILGCAAALLGGLANTFGYAPKFGTSGSRSE